MYLASNGHMSRPARGMAALLLLCGCTASAAPMSIAYAEDADGFQPIEGMTGSVMPACPKELQAAVKQCSISLTVTQDGQYSVCYCDSYGNRPVADLTLKPGQRNQANITSVAISKLTLPGDPTDPCITIKIDGTKEKVCW